MGCSASHRTAGNFSGLLELWTDISLSLCVVLVVRRELVRQIWDDRRTPDPPLSLCHLAARLWSSAFLDTDFPPPS